MSRLKALLLFGAALCSVARAGRLEEATVWWRLAGLGDQNGPAHSALEQVGRVRFMTGEVPGRFSDGHYARFDDATGASYLSAGPLGASGEIATALGGPSTIWVRVRLSAESRHGILSKDGSRDKPRGVLLFDDAALGNGLQGAIGFAKYVHGPTVDSLAPNVWHDLALVFDPGGRGIVIEVRRTEDAALISRATLPWSRGRRQSDGAGIPLMLGSYNGMAGSGLVGDVAEVAIWSRALSREETAMLTSSEAPPEPSRPRPARPYRQLFLDDERIAGRHNLTRVLHEGVRHERNPLIAPDKPWEGGQCFAYGGAVWVPEEEVYKIWYRCGQSPELYDYAIAMSRDGITWEKPVLETRAAVQARYDQLVAASPDYYGRVGHPQAPEASNIVMAHSEIQGFVYTPRDAGPRRYKALAGSTRVVSPDGVTWRWLGPAYQGVEVNPFSYSAETDRYLAFPKINHGQRRCVGFTRSTDFDTWEAPRLILVPDAEDDRIAAATIARYQDRIMVEHDDPDTRESHFYGLAGFDYEGMIVGFLWVLHVNAHVPALGDDGPMDVQLVASRDGEAWTRVAKRQPVLPLAAAGAFDSGMITTCSAPLVVGDEIRLYYGGIAYTHANQDWYLPGPVAARMRLFREGKADPPAALGLATWRLDGFVSMQAGEEEGELVTTPVVVNGGPLVLNADAQGGRIAVEVLDENGAPAAGFTAAACDAFTGDAVRHAVTWRGSSELSALAGRTCRLRFLMRRADLYSYVLENRHFPGTGP